jgi:hypothetical protein
MWLDSQWMEAGLEALRDTLLVEPRLRKQMIEFLLEEGLWDSEKLSWDAAVARWNACLNPKRPEFFKQSESWALMKRFQRFALFQAMAEDLGFEVKRIPTEERRQNLLERIAEAQERAASVTEACTQELQRLESHQPQRGEGGNCGGSGGNRTLFMLDDHEDASRGPF